MSSSFRPTPDLKDRVPVFMFPSDKVAQLYPQAPGFLFVAFYASQGYGGGFLTLLRTETILLYTMINYFKQTIDRHQKTRILLFN
jgi:hypothetical protein